MSNFKFQISNFKFLALGYWILVIGLFLYSYTQVDLNLTLSQLSIWQTIQKSFQYVGWFNRPLSTFIYLLLLVLLFVLYILFLRLIKSGKVTNKQFWQLVLPISGILFFSYNAFSYDLFNYMFDARIMTLYGDDPYHRRALDYPNDPWVNFMRWTHRAYPYGISWLWLTVPLSFVGMQIFLPTLFLFKALMVGGFIGTVFFIGKIAEKLFPEQKLFAMAFFALNPLVIIESLVSGHQDIVMMLFVVLGLYLLVTKRFLFAIPILLFAANIKFLNNSLSPAIHIGLSSGLALIVFFFWLAGKKKVEIPWDKVFLGGGVLMAIAVVLASQRTELQPWYILWVLPFVALLSGKRKFLLLPTVVVSLGLLLQYVPFLYTGNWDPPIPAIKMWLTGGSVVLGLLLLSISKAFKSK